MRKILIFVSFIFVFAGCSKDDTILYSTPQTPGEVLVASVDFDSVGGTTPNSVISKTGNIAPLLSGFVNDDTIRVTFLLKGTIAYDPYQPFFLLLDTSSYYAYSYNGNAVSHGYQSYNSSFAVLNRTFAYYKMYGTGNGTDLPFLAFKNLKIYKKVH